MGKVYSYKELEEVRKEYNQCIMAQAKENSLAYVYRGKKKRRVVWAVILIILAAVFLAFTIMNECKGYEMSQILEILKYQFAHLSDGLPADQPNVLGGVLCTGIALIIAFFLILGAISAGKKFNRLAAEMHYAREKEQSIRERYGYKGRNWDITTLKDSKEQLDALDKDTKDLFAALYIFQDESEVYHKNWLSKLGLDEANRMLEVMSDKKVESNPGGMIMIESKNSSWYVRVASIASMPIMTAVAIYGFAFDKPVDFDGREFFTKAYETNTNINRAEEDEDFLQIVKAVMEYLPVKLAMIVQKNIMEKLGG